MLDQSRLRLNHINVTVRPGTSEVAAAFYVEFFGMRRLHKSNRGRFPGAWLDMNGEVQLHLSEHESVPNPQSHFAIEVAKFDLLRTQLTTAGAPWEQLMPTGEARRAATADPSGNRVEIIERLTASGGSARG